jgi:hypothetical protein
MCPPRPVAPRLVRKLEQIALGLRLVAVAPYRWGIGVALTPHPRKNDDLGAPVRDRLGL